MQSGNSSDPGTRASAAAPLMKTFRPARSRKSVSPAGRRRAATPSSSGTGVPPPAKPGTSAQDARHACERSSGIAGALSFDSKLSRAVSRISPSTLQEQSRQSAQRSSSGWWRSTTCVLPASLMTASTLKREPERAACTRHAGSASWTSLMSYMWLESTAKRCVVSMPPTRGVATRLPRTRRMRPTS